MVHKNSPKIMGLNIQKPVLSRNARLYLASDVINHAFEVLVLGASTAEGLPTQHPYYASSEVYRLAIGGANSYELLRYYQHAFANNNIKYVVAVLNFYSFNAYRTPTTDFREDILDVDIHGQPNPMAPLRRLSNVVSIDTFRDAIKTVVAQEDGRPSVNRDTKLFQREDNSQELYTVFNNIDRHQLDRVLLPQPNRKFSLDQVEGAPSPFDYFRMLAKHAEEHGIKLDVIISPSHARSLGIINAAGLWPTFEAWKRDLTDLSTQHKNMNVWDFSGFHEYALSDVPGPGDPSRMTWYRDQIHFSDALGKKVLNRMAGQKEPFGLLLTQDNLEPHLQRQRVGLANWKAAFKRDSDDIDRIARKQGIHLENK
ncbi:MAG: hypothetical protein NUV50_11115 [Rhodospirillales bacterium]|nr:hypothetical protein [Rhodospirillales bacterium]